MTFVQGQCHLRKNRTSAISLKPVIPSKSLLPDPDKQDKLNEPFCDLILEDFTSQETALGSFTLFNLPKYSKEDLQQILKTVLKVKTPAPALQPLVFLDEPCKRPPKARFLQLYCT